MDENDAEQPQQGKLFNYDEAELLHVQTFFRQEQPDRLYSRYELEKAERFLDRMEQLRQLRQADADSDRSS
jgi:hypothetical protein